MLRGREDENPDRLHCRIRYRCSFAMDRSSISGSASNHRCSPHRSDEYGLCFSRSPSEAQFIILGSGLCIQDRQGWTGCEEIKRETPDACVKIVDRVPIEAKRDEGAYSLTMTWFRELRRCWAAGRVLAGRISVVRRHQLRHLSNHGIERSQAVHQSTGSQDD